jgi:hypothetical protein
MASGTLLLNPQRNREIDALLGAGRGIFAFAIVALGVETLVCAHTAREPLGGGYQAIAVLPWLPAIPWLALAGGAVWAACGIGLMFRMSRSVSAFLLGALYTMATLIIIVPRYVAKPGDMGLRTVVFEPLALASIACLLPGRETVPAWLGRVSRIVFAVAMLVFGVDHFLALRGIGTLVPHWIPWHVFWVGFFGAVFIVAGVGIGLGRLERGSWVAIGLMFAVWVVALHVPRTLGWLGIPGAITDPDEWSSLLIAMGLWGGPWAVARELPRGLICGHSQASGAASS